MLQAVFEVKIGLGCTKEVGMRDLQTVGEEPMDLEAEVEDTRSLEVALRFIVNCVEFLVTWDFVPSLSNNSNNYAYYSSLDVVANSKSLIDNGATN